MLQIVYMKLHRTVKILPRWYFLGVPIRLILSFGLLGQFYQFLDNRVIRVCLPLDLRVIG